MNTIDAKPEEINLYISTLWKVALADELIEREQKYIEVQGCLLGLSIETILDMKNSTFSTGSLKELPYSMKLMLCRDMYTLAAIDKALTVEEQKTIDEISLDLNLPKNDIASIKEWLDRYWALLKRGIRVPEIKTTKPEHQSNEIQNDQLNANEKLSKGEYLKALKKLQGKDAFSNVGVSLGTAAGAASGIGLASTLAGGFGATTLLGSSTLGTLLGGLFVTTTPIGWVVGSAAALGGLGYGVTKLVESGGENTIKRKILREKVESKVKEDFDAATNSITEKSEHLIAGLLKAVSSERLSVEEAEFLRKCVLEGKLAIDIAIDRLKKINSTTSAEAEGVSCPK